MNVMCLCSYFLHVFQGLKRIVGKRGAVDEGVASAGRGPMKEVGKGVQPLERGPSYPDKEISSINKSSGTLWNISPLPE